MSCQCHKVPGYVLLRFGNVVSNGAISIKQWGFINERFKVNPVGQWGKILVMTMGFVDHLEPRDTVFSNLSRDILNHKLPSLSPVSIDSEYK